MSDSILKRENEESFLDYFIRLFDNKFEYGLNKDSITELMNKEFGSTYDESKWRKDYSSYLKWKDYLINKNLDKEIADKYEEIRIESEKSRIRNNDQKREYRKLVQNQARFEDIKIGIHASILQLEKKKPLYFSPSPSDSNTDKHGIALFSDWHMGMAIDNSINTFNKDVFNKRVEKLVTKVIEYGKLNNISTLHIGQLGDLIAGAIHVSTRVQSNEDVIEQTTYVSEILSEILSKLANEFQEIKYYNVIGNHGRTGNKNDVGIKENFEYLIPWYLQARLKDFNNISIVSDEDGYISANILGQEIVFVHGNYDRIDQCVTRLPQALGTVPDYIFGGHIHHNYEKEFGITTCIVNGCLVGADDYAMQGRFGAKPSQKFLVVDENGVECTYVIKL